MVVSSYDKLSGLRTGTYRSLNAASVYTDTGYHIVRRSVRESVASPESWVTFALGDSDEASFEYIVRPVIAWDTSRRGIGALTAFLSRGQLHKRLCIPYKQVVAAIEQRHVVMMGDHDLAIFELSEPDPRLHGVKRCFE